MTRTLHFELSPHSAKAAEELTLHIGRYKQTLQTHTTQTLLKAAGNNRALATLPEDQRARFTHFVDVPAEHFPEDRLLRIRVTSPDENPDVYLPKLHHMSIHIPKSYREAHFRKKLARNGLHTHPKLTHLGAADLRSANLSHDEALQVSVDADDLQSPWDIATSILFHYPELASNKPYSATIVMNDHIAPPQNVDPTQYNEVYNLATVISKQGPASSTGGWAIITNSVDQYGNPLTYGYDMGTHKAGDPIYVYNWSDLTTQNATSPMTGAMQTASNDTSLQNQTWTVSQGKTAYQQDGDSTGGTLPKSFAASKRTALSAEADTSFKWTVKEETPNHGLSVYADTLTFGSDNTFSIQVKNTYLRTLTAYAEFFNENGDAIQNPPGWQEQLPSFIQGWFETDYKKYISTVSAVNTILGIPMPTDPTTLSFVFPDEATSLKLLFGCLGTSKWDGDVDPSGAIMTGIFQYGIPSLFLVAGAAITDSKWFNEFVSDTDNVVAALAVAFPIVGGGVATAAALTNVKSVLFAFADAMAGILLAKGLEKLALYVTEQITVAELEDEVPFVGWALRAANMAISFAEMAVTTGEILSSPATLTVDVARAMDLNFTLKPDPAHGEAGHPETAVWPAVADHYQVTVQYQGGTNFVLRGSMPTVTSGDPLNLVFSNIPVGGTIQIIAGIYSSSGWLCGKYQSDWMSAFPNSGSSLNLTENITEILVPLTQDTQYDYKEKIVYDAASAKHVWHAGDLPTATVASLDCSSGGNYICKPVDISLNGQAYQVGYVWSASGQNYMAQNVSVLADPQSRYKLSEVQFPVQPYIAYDQFGLQPDGGQAQQISTNNFILDTRNNQFNLRQVNLEDGSNGFGLNDPNLKSWGRFNLTNMDAMVVHPTGAVIGVSWKDSKMEILQIPSAPSDDNNAVDAQMVSGEGVRQGLLQGPKALAVTPDGRVLILETLNKRIQSFDTKGNPVASFLGESLFTLPAADFAPDLNNGVFSEALQLQFQTNGLTHIFDIASSLSTDLDQALLSENVINAFAYQGVYLSYDSTQMGNHDVSSYVTVIEAGSAWTVTDPTKNAIYDIKANDTVLSVYDVLNNVTVDVRAQNSIWVVEDWNGAQSYYIAADLLDSSTLNVNRYLSYMPLYNPDNRTDITYLDVSVEAKGYIYVLSYVAGGLQASDYILDIYEPDGTFLVRTPDAKMQPTNPQYVSAARLVVDVWRNVYTLNYEPIVGPNNMTEPSISHWVPTTPVFDLDLSKQPDFENNDVAAVQADFAANGVTLANPTTIETVSESGYWKVSDPTQTYEVIRSGPNLEVYSIPVA